jgi:hypothetical protein
MGILTLIVIDAFLLFRDRYINIFQLDRFRAVSADLKGSQFGRFRWEPRLFSVVAEHTDASTAV